MTKAQKVANEEALIAIAKMRRKRDVKPVVINFPSDVISTEVGRIDGYWALGNRDMKDFGNILIDAEDIKFLRRVLDAMAGVTITAAEKAQ